MVRRSLDVAIARVAEKEYRRLSTGKTQDKRLACVKQALDSLKGLKEGNKPEYNEWDALFYLTWYQPRHINLALAIVRHFFSGNSLHVIDVGCGAFAVQIAVAVATAEKRRGSKIKVTVQGIDPSEPMRSIGKKLWKEFCSIVDKTPRLSSLSQVCNTMTDSCDSHNSRDSYYHSADAHVGSGSSSTECWLMAMHAIYESNKTDLKKSLSALRRKSAPVLEVVTCPEFKVEKAREVVTSRSRERKADRFAGKGFDDEELCKVSERPDQIGQVTVEYAPVRDILTRATGFMDAYDFTLNPYAGCSFGCTYCYAAFFSHSTEKRDSWGRWLEVKDNAAERLERRRQGSLDGKLIYMSSVTDPYQPIERKLELTRQLLEIMARRHRPKLVVQTRSPDVVRDCDLFRLIVSNGGRVQVNLTVTTDDEDVRRTFEPYCPDNRTRLRAARELYAEGVDTCITMTPLLLVRDARQFASELLDTGVEKFIAQPFHFQRGKFLAGTRDMALCLMAEKLSSDMKTFHRAYLNHYQHVRTVLSEQLPGLGEGKDGFRPPF